MTTASRQVGAPGENEIWSSRAAAGRERTKETRMEASGTARTGRREGRRLAVRDPERTAVARESRHLEESMREES
jgi:hypothetical protein